MVAFSGIALSHGLTGGEGSILAVFRAAYAGSRVLVAGHQLLHAPFCLAALFIAAFAAGLLHVKLGRWLRSFLYGAMAHAVVDVFTHVDDGPLLLWPFDASMRVASPISHWDAAHCAAVCVFVETIICLAAMRDALFSRLRRRLNAVSADGPIARPT